MIPVKEIFKSMQGEGKNAGKMAVFVRVGKCNLECSFCDTDFSNPQDMPIGVIADIVGTMLRENGISKVVFTGGEPSLFLREIGEVIRKMVVDSNLYEICDFEIETNGSTPLKEFLVLVMICEVLAVKLTITISPKKESFITGDTEPIRSNFAEVIVKLLVENPEYPYLLDKVTELWRIDRDNIYLQPMNNSLLIARDLIKYNLHGCRLSLQQHKILSVE